MSDLERPRPTLTGEVLPMEGDEPSGLDLTVGEAWALWDWLEGKDGPRYWEDVRLAGLQDKIKTWIKTDARW